MSLARHCRWKSLSNTDRIRSAYDRPDVSASFIQNDTKSEACTYSIQQGVVWDYFLLTLSFPTRLANSESLAPARRLHNRQYLVHEKPEVLGLRVKVEVELDVGGADGGGGVECGQVGAWH